MAGLGAWIAAAGCTAPLPRTPPPTIQQLMQQAVTSTEQQRAASLAGRETILASARQARSTDTAGAPGDYAREVDSLAARQLPADDSIGSLLADAVVEGAAEIHPAQAAEAIGRPAAANPFRRAGNTLATDIAAEPIPAPDPALQVEPQRISEEFFETDVREAIALLAAEVEADVLVDDQIGGVVNATINNATFDEALEKILLPLGFVLGRRGEQYIVSQPDPEAPLFPFVSTQIEYRPRYVKASDLLTAPPRQMQRFVRVVENSNTLVVEAPTQFLDVILSRIEALDRPAPQVELEAIVCVLSPESSKQFGIDWGHTTPLNGVTALNLNATGLALSGAITPAGLKDIFNDFATTSTFVQLLAQNGYLSIKAAPRLTAQDGERANIKIGQETFFALLPPGANADNAAFFFQQDIQQVESGIELDIVPRIRGDTVTIEIARAEVSEDIQTTTNATSSNAFPVINRRSVSTTVHVEDGKTVVIGGLAQEQTVDVVNRVPGLSRIPLLGYLFRSSERQKVATEVVIFISPRIVRPSSAEAPLELNYPSPP